MKKRIKFSCFLTLLLLPLVFSIKAEAFDQCNPCHCGCWSLTPKVGFSPAINYCRTDRSVEYASSVSGNTLLSCATDGQIQTQLEISEHKIQFPNFHDQFEYPWQVGIDLNYCVSDHAEVFLDLNYTQARGKTHQFTVTDTLIFPDFCTTPPDSSFAIKDEFHEDYDDLKEWSGYLGCRYYTSRCCCASLFFGSKVGVRYRNSVGYRLKIRETTEGNKGELIDNGKFEFFKDHLVVSAGFQIGIDYSISKCCTVILMGEAVGSGCYKTNSRKNERVIEFERDASTVVKYITDRKITGGNVGTVVNFPITFGVKLAF